MPLPVPISLNQPSDYVVFTLINRDNPGANLSPYRVNLGTPTPTTNNPKRNTTLMVSAIEEPGTRGRNYLGSTPITYNRLDLDNIFNNTAGVVVVDDPETSVDLLVPINKAFKLQLSKDDIVQEPVSGDHYTLKAAPGSFVYIGETLLELIPSISDEDIDLAKEILVRGLSGFNLTTAEPDSAVPSKQALLDLINTDNQKTYTLVRVTFDLPAPILNDDAYNSAIVIRGLEGFGYKGAVFLTYNRVDISEVVSSSTALSVTEDSPVTIRGMLGAINAAYELALRPDEIVDGEFDPETAEEIVLEINQRSEVWLPGTKIAFAVTRDGGGGENPEYPDLPSGQYVLIDGGLVGVDDNTVLQFGD